MPNFTPSATNYFGSWKTNIKIKHQYAKVLSWRCQGQRYFVEKCSWAIIQFANMRTLNKINHHIWLDVNIIAVNFNTYVSTPRPDHSWHFPKCKLGWNSFELLQKFFQTCQKLSRDSVHIIQTACEISPCVCFAIKVGLWDDSLGLFHNLCSHSRSSKF